MTDWYNEWIRNHLPKPDTIGEKKRKVAAYQKAYRERNREKLAEYHRRYYRKNIHKWKKPKPEHDYKQCAVCGAPFYPFHFSDKYCSAKCRMEMRRGNIR